MRVQISLGPPKNIKKEILFMYSASDIIKKEIAYMLDIPENELDKLEEFYFDTDQLRVLNICKCLKENNIKCNIGKEDGIPHVKVYSPDDLMSCIMINDYIDELEKRSFKIL
ncbi:MAG: hypothetical protein ACOCV1_05110 [Bacillota bacterium]